MNKNFNKYYLESNCLFCVQSSFFVLVLVINGKQEIHVMYDSLGNDNLLSELCSMHTWYFTRYYVPLKILLKNSCIQANALCREP